ncbi:MAG: transglutaminase-like domain-containing protein, partial [Sphingobacteriaceae bacterium]
SMEAAVLEVNHWCHEKVIYRSTDDRTSSPLNCVKTTFGRCGEESTLLVTALRSVGIPARQCYTPRWAHCDDNHAWVEAWVDGKWKYLGACEPEAELNKGWFTGPSKRAMLVNTTVFGDYQGPEAVLEKTPWYTKINVLSNYTKTKKIVVQVIDQQNQPIENANVAFKLYNYAEFYSLSNQLTDKNGFCNFETGFGDLLIWASKGDAYYYQKITVANIDTLVLSIANKPVFMSTPFTPPADTYQEPKTANPNQAKLARRLKQDDSLRANQLATFPDSAQIKNWAIKNNLPVEQSIHFITISAGNFQTIQAFLLSYSKHQDWKFELLQQISEKDLRDISLTTLLDHLNNSQYLAVLNPRIGNEMSSAYKNYFQKHFDTQFQQKAKADISFLVKWFQQNIQIEKQANYYNIPMSPIGVAQLKHADLPSRNILFVAMCRSFGIPARIEPEYAQVQVKSNDQLNWQTINFEKTSKEIAANATLKLIYQNPSAIAVQYGLNFSIAKISNGKAQTINFENNPIFAQFPVRLSLTPGNYIVITGNRLSDGTVCSNIYPVTLAANQLVVLPFEMFIPKAQNKMLGSIDATHQVLINQQYNSIASFKNTNGLAILCLDLPAEPSKHVIVELQSLKQQWQAMQFPLLVLLPQESKLLDIKKKYLSFFPKNTSFALDPRFSVQKRLKMVKSKTNAPLLML